MKLLWGPAEHLRCHWSGSHWALHQDSCNDFTNPLYSGSNHSRGRSHAAGNCFTVTGTDQRPPIIKGDDGPKRDIDTTSLQIIAATWHRSQNSVAIHLDKTTNVLSFCDKLKTILRSLLDKNKIVSQAESKLFSLYWPRRIYTALHI